MKLALCGPERENLSGCIAPVFLEKISESLQVFFHFVSYTKHR